MGFTVSNDFKRQILQSRLAELNQEGFVYQVNYLTADHLGMEDDALKATEMCNHIIRAIAFTEGLIAKIGTSDNEV